MKKGNLITILEYYQNAVNWTEKLDFGVKFNELKIEITFKETSIFFDSYAYDFYADDFFDCDDLYTYVFTLNDKNLGAILYGLKYSNYEVLGYSILRITVNNDMYYTQDENKEIPLNTFIYVVSNAIYHSMPSNLSNTTNCTFTVEGKHVPLCVKNNFFQHLMVDLFKYYDAKKFNDGTFKCDLSYTIL